MSACVRVPGYLPIVWLLRAGVRHKLRLLVQPAFWLHSVGVLHLGRSVLIPKITWMTIRQPSMAQTASAMPCYITDYLRMEVATRKSIERSKERRKERG